MNYKLKSGLVILLILIILAALGPVLAGKYWEQNLKESLNPPNSRHLFGTDLLGRDMLGRVANGARSSLLVGLLAVVLTLTVGLPLGALAGYFGGRLDTVIMRMADVFLAFPLVLGALLFMSVAGAGFANILLVLALLGWPYIARIFRASVLSNKELDYVVAARALGAGDWYLLRRHIIPNAIGPVLIFALMNVGTAIMAESVLSFLGVGLRLPNASWGYLLSEAAGLQNVAPWLIYFPGIALTVTVLAFTLLGEGLRVYLAPKENNV